MKGFVRISDHDNVIVAVIDLKAGSVLDVAGHKIAINENIPAGHKICIRDIVEGEDVIKYANPIGHATRSIKPGDWVHVHNMTTNLSGIIDYNYTGYTGNLPIWDDVPTFLGYKRSNGEVGVRNDLYIIPTVGCVNQQCRMIAKMAQEKGLAENFDNVIPITHTFGCSQTGEDLERTKAILAGLAANGNAGGILIVGLGCECIVMRDFEDAVITDDNRAYVKTMIAQEHEDEIEIGLQHVQALNTANADVKREPISLARLKLGVKCGGSDGFSGISANPLTGRLADKLYSSGAAVLMTEVPEMFGAEHLLMQRCVDEPTFRKVEDMINTYKRYFARYGEAISDNPSPGNKDGGISSLEDKSLGCIQKGGNVPVVDVLYFGEKATKNGLSLVYGPGNDHVSLTNLMACGAHIIVFTTGRGTPWGAPVPTVKMATNARMAGRKKNWIDFDASPVLDDKTFEEMADALFAYIIDVASGKQTLNEVNACQEIAIFKDGVTE